MKLKRGSERGNGCVGFVILVAFFALLTIQLWAPIVAGNPDSWVFDHPYLWLEHPGTYSYIQTLTAEETVGGVEFEVPVICTSPSTGPELSMHHLGYFNQGPRYMLTYNHDYVVFTPLNESDFWPADASPEMKKQIADSLISRTFISRYVTVNTIEFDDGTLVNICRVTYR